MKTKKVLSLVLALAVLAAMTVPALAANRSNDASKLIMELTEMLYPVDGAKEAQATFAAEFAGFLLTVPTSDSIDILESVAWLEGTLGGKEMAQLVTKLHECWVKEDTAELTRYRDGSTGSSTPAGDSVPEGMPAEATPEQAPKPDTPTTGTSGTGTSAYGDGWDGVWVMDGNTLAIIDKGQRMYHVNADGMGFSISVMDNEISAGEIHSVIQDPAINYMAEYHMILTEDTLDFTHIYYVDGTDPITVPDSGVYTRTRENPYTTYDEMRG